MIFSFGSRFKIYDEKVFTVKEDFIWISMEVPFRFKKTNVF